MNARNVTLSTILTIVYCLGVNSVEAASSFSYRTPAPAGPADPIVVYVDLTSTLDNIAAVASRLTYDASKVSLVSLEKGAAVPASWSFIYQESATPGEVDFALTDQTSSAAVISPAPTASEVVKLTFSRVGGGCASVAVGFNGAPPGLGAASAAFPQNHYVISVGVALTLETATTSAGSVPTTADHSFIRGNVSNRIAHNLDIQDVLTLVGMLFQGVAPGFSCDAAFDVNNDEAQNLVDVVALVQGLFGVAGYDIPPPGPVTPEVGSFNGGPVPSLLGCAEGELCL